MPRRSTESAFAGLEHELLADAAYSLGLAGGRVEAAVAALAACPADAGARPALLAGAAAAAYAYVVQREAMGWRDTDAALDLYGVPAEVRARMGAHPAPGR